MTQPVIDIAPGERFDVVVDFSVLPVGTEVTMINALGVGPARATCCGSGWSGPPATTAGSRTGCPMWSRWRRLRTLRGARSGSPAGAVGDHRGWTINGQRFDPDAALAEIPLGRTEVWRFVTDVHHPVHVHLDPFQVLRRGARGPGPLDGGWKDTVDLRPAEVVDVAVRFSRARRPVRAALPQPGARGHGHDGHGAHRLSLLVELDGRKRAGRTQLLQAEMSSSAVRPRRTADVTLAGHPLYVRRTRRGGSAAHPWRARSVGRVGIRRPTRQYRSTRR